MKPAFVAHLSIAVLAVGLGAWQRARAVQQLPPDFDELVYLPVAFRYAERLTPGRYAEVASFRPNLEHPPLVKLTYAAALKATAAAEPKWDSLRVGRPMPDEARPTFAAGRWPSFAAGVAQLGLLGWVNPPAALILAVEPYHSKYTAQAYLEAIPGLFALLAIVLFERSVRPRDVIPPPLHRSVPLWLSAVALGAAAAGKYPYGLVVALTVAPFLVRYAPRRPRLWAAYAAVTLLAFFLLDPFLWPSPPSRLWETLRFHWSYSHGEHVQKTGLPWYQPYFFLTTPVPLKWHPGVFFTGITAWILLPLAGIGAGLTARRRPIFAAWAGVGLVFLFLWPTKWPQYLLLVLPALAVCAGHAPEAILASGRWGLRKLRPPAPPPA